MPGRDLVTALDQPDQLVDDRLGRAHLARLALEREHVAAQVELAVELPLERRAGPRPRSPPAPRPRRCRASAADAPRVSSSLSRTAALTRLPSARPPTFGITAPITLPILLGPWRPTPRSPRRRAPELIVGELRGQVGLDHLRLGLLGGGALLAAALAEGLRRLEPALALAAEHSDLVVVARFASCWRAFASMRSVADALASRRLHRLAGVRLDLFENRHAGDGSPAGSASGCPGPGRVAFVRDPAWLWLRPPALKLRLRLRAEPQPGGARGGLLRSVRGPPPHGPSHGGVENVLQVAQARHLLCEPRALARDSGDGRIAARAPKPAPPIVRADRCTRSITPTGAPPTLSFLEQASGDERSQDRTRSPGSSPTASRWVCREATVSESARGRR